MVFFFFKFSASLLQIISRTNKTSLCTYAGSGEDICPIIVPLMLLYLEVGTFALPPRKSPCYPYSHCDFHLNNLHTTAHNLCVVGICARSLDILVILDDDSKIWVTMCASSWFGCLWSQIMHVVEKFHQVCIESGGECFGFIEFGIYWLKCSFLLS